MRKPCSTLENCTCNRCRQRRFYHSYRARHGVHYRNRFKRTKPISIKKDTPPVSLWDNIESISIPNLDVQRVSIVQCLRQKKTPIGQLVKPYNGKRRFQLVQEFEDKYKSIDGIKLKRKRIKAKKFFRLIPTLKATKTVIDGALKTTHILTYVSANDMMTKAEYEITK